MLKSIISKWLWIMGLGMSVTALSVRPSSVLAESSSSSSVLAESSSSLSAGLRVLKGWQKKMIDGADLSLNWEQIQYKALRDRYVKSQGKGIFSHPQKFVWDLKSSSQAWIYDGTHLYHLDRRANKAYVYPSHGSQSRQINRFVGLITRFDRLTDEYHLKSFREDSSHLFFELIPKQLGDLKKVKVAYLKSKTSISQIRMNFVSGNYTQVNFSAQRRSQLPRDAFGLPKTAQIQKTP